jgi:hypothetical protein
MHGPHTTENHASSSSSIVACVFVAAVRFLMSRFPATIGRLLPSRCLTTIGGYTYKRTNWWEGFMKYTVLMGTGAIIYTQSFIKFGFAIQKLTGWINR